ncbi:MAG: hypothetical protein CM15mP111_0270 [Hyphomicrobiales bacterium]|nr:MAG: hypothetical protein CM15mP111_0270 [Hyphomicrobiales bacterium]
MIKLEKYSILTLLLCDTHPYFFAVVNSKTICDDLDGKSRNGVLFLKNLRNLIQGEACVSGILIIPFGMRVIIRMG